MYGAKVPTVAGVSILPVAGHSRPLLIVAAGLIACGVAVFVIAFVLSRKARRSQAN